MTSRRLELQSKLEEILGSKNVYFQPPGTLRMKYPCIRYTRDRGNHLFADDKTYRYEQAYQIMYIDPDPDSDIIDKLLEHFPMISYNRHYVADNLNHDVFILYY